MLFVLQKEPRISRRNWFFRPKLKSSPCISWPCCEREEGHDYHSEDEDDGGEAEGAAAAAFPARTSRRGGIAAAATAAASVAAAVEYGRVRQAFGDGASAVWRQGVLFSLIELKAVPSGILQYSS